MSGYPTPPGEWQSRQRKTTFLFLEMRLPGSGHGGKIKKLDGQDLEPGGRKILGHVSEQ